MEDIYYETPNISYKTLNIFEELYNDKKEEIIKIIINNIKEKYNIDINNNGKTIKSCDVITNNTNTHV
tara:strand:- start:343 stop:546 length:204 start_codon:yes stop_codon:yes gene_type:complete